MGDQAGGAQVILREVAKRYPVGRDSHLVATDAVSLQIEAGGTVALAGTSGSGKSTLLHLMGAMDTPDEGTITVDGVDLAGLSLDPWMDERLLGGSGRWSAFWLGESGVSSS